MAQQDSGPATGTAALLFGGGTTSIEVHIPTGSNPLGPASSPYVDPEASTYQDTAVTKGVVTNPTNKAVNFASLGTGIQFTIPA